MNGPELLAPAGCLEAAISAADAGADAIYLGVGKYNARIRAENFSIDNIERAVRYCLPRGVRVYLAMNTLLKDSELSDAYDTVLSAYEMGIDAVIIQDIALLKRIRSSLPGLKIHASTQMNLFSSHSIRDASREGISRVVLPRELSIDSIRSRALVAEKNGVETEVFVHGALCVSYSGLCLMSAMSGSGERSGNRGSCAQPCREQYDMFDGNNRKLHSGSLFSVCDLSAVSFLEDLIQARVHSLKIEGRMRDTGYVIRNVSVYRRLIDTLLSGGKMDALLKKESTEKLLLSYNRGGRFTDGYLSGDRSSLFSGDYTGKYGVYVGRIVKTDSRTGEMEIILLGRTVLKPKDVLSIRNNNKEEASFPIGKITGNDKIALVKGLHPDTMVKLSSGAEVYLSKSNDVFNRNHTPETIRKTSVRFLLENLSPGNRMIRVALVAENLLGDKYIIDKNFSTPKVYEGRPLSHERVTEQLSKTSDTPFRVKSVEIDKNIQLRAPISFINSIRRTMTNELEVEIRKKRFSELHSIKADTVCSARDDSDNVIGSSKKSKQSQFALEYISMDVNDGPLYDGSNRYIFSVYDLSKENHLLRIDELAKRNPEAKFHVRFPSAFSDTSSAAFEYSLCRFQNRFDKFFLSVISGERFDESKNRVISHQANIYNSESLAEALSHGPAGFFLSEELSDEEYIEVFRKISSQGVFSEHFIFRYGPIEYMRSAFCPLGRNREGCTTCSRHKIAWIQSKASDRLHPDKSQRFLLFHPEDCTVDLFGSALHKRSAGRIDLLKDMRIDMIHTVRVLSESPEQIHQILTGIRSNIDD